MQLKRIISDESDIKNLTSSQGFIPPSEPPHAPTEGASPSLGTTALRVCDETDTYVGYFP
jgi:hypothetical protein